ncbi:MAG: hypothetical protein LH603_05440 [Pseudonocardia sp.]|nr:hypothetical protein [Pseudonocardia sp.]
MSEIVTTVGASSTDRQQGRRAAPGEREGTEGDQAAVTGVCRSTRAGLRGSDRDDVAPT